MSEMTEHARSFKTFFENYSDQFKDCDCTNKSFTALDQYPLLPSQAIYVVNWKDMEISYQRGISELLGYSEQEFNHDLLSRFYHPDDFKRYFYLLKLSNKWARKLSPDPFSVETSIDYRIRKKDGSYVKVLRQSTVFQNCVNNKIMSAFSILTDISRIKTNTSINLSVIHRESGRVILEEIENSPDTIEFSKREKEILLKLKSGLGSKAIADELFISRHTVDTHRRKMLAKAKCKNVMELISCATMIGVI